MRRNYAARALLTSLPLVASDLLALFAGLLLSQALVGAVLPGLGVELPLVFALLSLGMVPANAAFRLYPGSGLHGVAELERSVIASSLIYLTFVLSDFVSPEGGGFRAFLITAGLVNLTLAPTFRAMTRAAVSRFAWWRQPLLVLGGGADSKRVSDYFESNPGLGFSPVRVNGDHAGSSRTVTYNQLVQEPHTVAWLAERHKALSAAVPLGGEETDGQELLLEQCANVFPQLLVIPEPRRLPDFWTSETDIGGAVGLRVGTSLLNPLTRGAKRVIDYSLTVPIALLALPLFVLVAIVVRATSSGPVLFGSERIGRGRRRFHALKFRTMHVDSDRALERALKDDEHLLEEWQRTNKLRGDPRITPVGRWLRRSSLDELPQLWNVLRGDMSLVGPRPILPEEVSRRGKDLGLYLSVRPGLTGLWQISGRSSTSYDQRIFLDSYYVRNWSPWLDLHILARTMTAVLSGKGAH